MTRRQTPAEAAASVASSAQATSATALWVTLPFPETYPETASSGYSDLNGIRLFHAEWGSGDPVILLHGGLASIEAFAYLIPVISDGNRVIAIDSRGHGRSTRDETTYSYELMTSDVIALMDEMRIDKAAFVGWSDGGIISLEMAINHPERISKALVIGTNYNLEGSDPSAETSPLFGRCIDAMAALYAEISPTPGDFEAFVDDIAAMWSSQPNYTEAQLQTVTVPFTVVQALKDEAITDAHAEKMAELLPGSTYVPLEGVSHFAMWQDPKRFNALVVEFLK